MSASQDFEVAGDEFAFVVEVPDGPTCEPVAYRVWTRAEDDGAWSEIARFTVHPGRVSLHHIDNFLRHVRFEPIDPPRSTPIRVTHLLPRDP
jgi:hypothetical protein